MSLRNSVPEAAAVRLILTLFRNRGWRDEGGAALSVVAAVFDDFRVLESVDGFERCLPEEFVLVNGVSSEDVRAALLTLSDPLEDQVSREAALIRDPLLQISDIDSFSKVRDIAASEVAGYARPLDLSEDVVERMIAKIVGEPNLVKDWGGEVDDLYTGQVVLDGRNVRTSFVLKGRGLRGPLKPKNLGHNGDQITRMMTRPASLFIVQHVNRVDPQVTKQLSDAVLARRAEGRRLAVGSVWDGVDTARLGVAYGFLDPVTGTLRPGVLR